MAETFIDWLMPTVPLPDSDPCFGDQAMAHWKCDGPASRRRVFWHALPRGALPLAALLWLVRREFFARDFAFIRELGQTRDATEFYILIEQFRDETIRSGGWLRNSFRLRVSGRRLRRLRWELRQTMLDLP